MTVDGIGFTVTASGSSSGTVSGDPFSLPDDNTDPRNPRWSRQTRSLLRIRAAGSDEMMMISKISERPLLRVGSFSAAGNGCTADRIPRPLLFQSH